MTKYNEIFDISRYPSFKNGYQPDEDGPCICLSGKKYKECCKEKVIRSRLIKYLNMHNDGLEELYKTKYEKLPSRRLFKKDIVKKKLSFCLACKVLDDCTIDNKNNGCIDTVYSHTLSRGVVLKNLCNNEKDYVKQIDDHVMINDTDKKASDRYIDIDIHKASITVAFCKKHDEWLFEDVEKEGHKDYCNYEIQNLEYALKAISFEIYDLAFSVDYMVALINENINVVYEDENFSGLLMEYAIKLDLMKSYLKTIDKLIIDIKKFKEENKKSDIETLVIPLAYKRVEYSLAEVLDGCFVNIINAPKPFIIVSYYPDIKIEDQEILLLANNYKLSSSNENLKLITEYIISNSKNIYFNKSTIDSLSEKVKEELYYAHRWGIGYGKVSKGFIDIMMTALYKK